MNRLTSPRSYSCGAGVRRRSQSYHSCMPARVVAETCSIRALGLDLLTSAACSLLSKSTQGSRSVLLTQDEIGPAEHVRVLHRRVVALGDRSEHHPGLLAEVEQGRADQVAHVLDHDYRGARRGARPPCPWQPRR